MTITPYKFYGVCFLAHDVIVTIVSFTAEPVFIYLADAIGRPAIFVRLHRRNCGEYRKIPPTGYTHHIFASKVTFVF